MKLTQRISKLASARPGTLLLLVSVLAVTGPVVVVLAGLWDAVSHLQKEPEFFWSSPHVAVYAGVTMSSVGAALGGILLYKKSATGLLKTGIQLVIIGSVIQVISGFGDSLSHDLFGIDGLISWSHQPLELGLVLASLGAVFIIKNREHTKLRFILPFSIVTFLFFTIWLGFNLVLIIGHTVQCIPVYEIFSSGCAIL